MTRIFNAADLKESKLYRGRAKEDVPEDRNVFVANYALKAREDELRRKLSSANKSGNQVFIRRAEEEMKDFKNRFKK